MNEINLNKILICRIGWMDKYDGLSEIHRGGSFIKDNGYGYEAFNFKPYLGKMYGYVQPPPKNNDYLRVTLHIEKLGASIKDPFIDDILVVWVASKNSLSGMHIVGWYKNAKVHRKVDKVFQDITRKFPNGHFQPYRIESKETDCILLSSEERLKTPLITKGKSGMGQANILYPNKKNIFLRTTIIKFINSFDNLIKIKTLNENLKESFKILVNKKLFMKKFFDNYLFNKANINSLEFVDNKEQFLRFIAFCLNTRQRKNNKDFDEGIRYFEENYKKILDAIQEKNLIKLQNIIYSAKGVGQKIGSMIIGFIFLYSKYEDDNILENANLPIDTHTKRILEDSFGIAVPEIGIKADNRRFIGFQSELEEHTINGKHRIYFDYFWFIGKVFCTKTTMDPMNKGYRLCSMCWINKCCQNKEKWNYDY